MNLEEENNLKDTIKAWLDISAVDLTDNDYFVSASINRYLHDSLEIGSFNRLKSKFDFYNFAYLFYEMRKSNTYRNMYYHKSDLLVKHRYQMRLGYDYFYYAGFELKVILKSNYSEVSLQTTIERFNLTLKQDNILNNYTFKVAIYNDNMTGWYDKYYIHILLLNTKDLIKLVDEVNA